MEPDNDKYKKRQRVLLIIAILVFVWYTVSQIRDAAF